MYDVAVLKYEKPFESLEKAVHWAGGLDGISIQSKVVIKPNILVWLEGGIFPKYGVLTTARMIEDLVVLLKESGVRRIVILEGIGFGDLQAAGKGMGFDILEKRYGVQVVDVWKSDFVKINVGGATFSISKEFLEADYRISMPVLKTHGQAMVSLGIKNLKGLIDQSSRKLFHNGNLHTDLDYHLARLAEVVPTCFTIIDGIYTLERGPNLIGDARRSDIIIASKDLLSGDKVGAAMLGVPPQTVPHLFLASERKNRPTDLSDINIKGDIDVSSAAKSHEWRPARSQSNDMPLLLAMAGVKGVNVPPMDKSVCTFCVSCFYLYVNMGLLMASNMDKCFDDIEFLAGKTQDPTGTHKHTMLLGQCQVNRNENNPLIRHCVKVGGCPPREHDYLDACKEVGIELPAGFPASAENAARLFLMGKYKGKKEFDEMFYQIQ
jgi:uncharacterized protein (DUF362 family)